MRPDPFREYLSALEANLTRGDATEHTHRSALKALFESLEEGVTATNEPKRRVDVGAPDLRVSKGLFTIGHVETKNVGASLDEAENSDQLKRYRAAFHNLILTDYIEFRWYEHGSRRLSARLASLDAHGRIHSERGGAEDADHLLIQFLTYPPQAPSSPRELAIFMARRAHMIRQMILATLRAEPQSGPLHDQLTDFRQTLLPGLTPEQFADMFAQTIAYGLFAARSNHLSGVFSRQTALWLISKTNPFLRDLFTQIAGPSLDDRIVPDADYLTELLAHPDVSAAFEHFARRTGREDPVFHFYETFLKEYDPKTREMRGVYYTPEQVVSYIVRSVDYLLKTKFNRRQGMADSSVLILDPACGTGTFLYYVINEIHQSQMARGQAGVWSNYVAKHLLPRLFGFELLMAPYAIAHLKLETELRDLGHHFAPLDRLGVYLANTLAEMGPIPQPHLARSLDQEGRAAARIKHQEPIMVVLGNPPYSAESANKGAWITSLIQDYKTVDGQPLREKNPKPLQDDYVKFIRFGQWRIERTGQGILAFITNHSYLDNPTFRGMRQSLIDTFTDIYILDLHGNSRKKEATPEGGKDENVFDIQQGVAIGIFVKDPANAVPAKVHHADLWGLRKEKYSYLEEADVSGTEWAELNPHSPHYLFIPFDDTLAQEYEQTWKITEVFTAYSEGVKTHRDHFAVAFDREELRQRIQILRRAEATDVELRERFGLSDTGSWALPPAREGLRKDRQWEGAMVPYLYRPFDVRHLFYHGAVVDRPRRDVMHHMLAGRNLALIANRQIRIQPIQHTWAAHHIVDLHILETANASACVFPLYLYPEGERLVGAYSHTPLPGERRPNLSQDFIRALSEKLGLEFIPDGRGDMEKTFGPEDVFDYAYAVFHSPTYRSRYAQFLRIDFPRLPLTSDRSLFKALAEKGGELVSLHLMESPKLENLITGFPISDSNLVEKVRYSEPTADTPGRVYINKEQYFERVPPEVWEFQVGGYQVLEKWLKDRKGRELSYDDVVHYQKVVVALTETIRLMAEIDRLIPEWPVR